jgi:Predicted dehydrogenases and related proteins
MTTSSDPAPVSWGIVSTGTIAGHFAEGLRHAGNARLHAVVSRDAARAEAFAAAHGAARAYGSLDAFLADPGIEAVYVAAPNHAHVDMARAALEAGKAVLVEKPLATSSREAEDLAALADARGLFLMEGLWTRFLPAFGLVRDRLAEGAIGDVRSVSGELCFRHAYDPASRLFDPAAAGGVLLDLGVYGISILRHLLGAPETVEAAVGRAPSGVDSRASLAFSYKGGVRAGIRVSFEEDGANLLILRGTGGDLVVQAPFIGARSVLEIHGGLGALARMPGAGFLARAARKAARSGRLPGIVRHDCDFPGYGLQFEIAAASAAIRDGATGHPLSPLADTIATLKVIEAAKAG